MTLRKLSFIKKALLLLVVFCSFFLLSLSQAKAQQKKDIKNYIFTEKTTLKNDISANQKHHCKIQLKENQFLILKLEQQNADVIITTYDSENNKIENFDSPNGKFGTEIILLNSTKAGEYTLEVEMLEKNAEVGKYELFVKTIKPKAITPNEKIDELLSIYDNSDTPGVAVSVTKDGKTMYQKGFGMANLEYNIPISPTSIFSVASVSKQFTAFSILLLEAEGKLSLDDDIKKYIPELEHLNTFGKTITLRNLANHTSGTREQSDLLYLAGVGFVDVVTNEDAFKIVTNQKEINFEVGSQYEYCNSAFMLLAKVVERVSGKSFSEFTKEKIFTPLNMKNSFFLDDAEKIIKNRVYSYCPFGSGYQKSLLNYSIVGSTGLCTTVEDLSLWALNFQKGIVGNTAIFDKMQKKSKLNSGEEISYALGQEIKNYKGLEVIFHGGGDAGYRSYLLRIPSQNFTLAIAGNSETFNPLSIAYKIVDYYLENELTAPKITEVKETINIKNEILKSYQGNYEVIAGLFFTITSNSDTLFVETSDNNQKTELYPISENEFMMGNYKLSFHKKETEKDFYLKLTISDFEYNGKKVFLKSFDKLKVDVEEYTGRYYSEELGTSYIFKVKDNKLVATHSRNKDIILNPFQENLFIGNEWFFRKVEFIRNKKLEIIACKVYSTRATIIFEKED